MDTMLYVVATPIGNLNDITFRAVEILKEVDFIVCEDTRITSRLLQKLGIKKELLTLNARNEESRIKLILNKILSGHKCALVSDAGTPCISDPGVRLINASHKNNITVSSVPGPNAAIAALSIAGIPTDSFLFEGFLPQKKGRQKLLKELSLTDKTIILYESTYRIEKLLNELNEFMQDRFVVICRELTKMYEEIVRGYPPELVKGLADMNLKGEFVVCIAPVSWQQL
ncbi:MAG: 16S rRNA (cytidine(1402)-2'-O)-methyltransferase [Melioribacteraceae bacterium]|nr:16S rRNA (cytidine(1402)-2'-O)-methyltransferase [Melioribacteraceae bacterium]